MDRAWRVTPIVVPPRMRGWPDLVNKIVNIGSGSPVYTGMLHLSTPLGSLVEWFPRVCGDAPHAWPPIANRFWFPRIYGDGPGLT